MSIENAKLLLALAKLEADRQVERIASARSHLTPPHLVAKMEAELAELRQQMVNAGAVEAPPYRDNQWLVVKVERAIDATLQDMVDQAAADRLNGFGEVRYNTILQVKAAVQNAMLEARKIH